MSVSLDAKAYSSKENKEFQKHFNSVKFCIENDLSFPKETSEFFKGKIWGDDLEDFKPEAILDYLRNGLEVNMPFTYSEDYEVKIKVSDIPSEVDFIVVSLS